MWRYALSAVIGASLTAIAWSVLVKDMPLKHSTKEVIVFVGGVLVAVGTAVFTHFFGSVLAPEEKPLTERILSKHNKLRRYLYLLGIVVGIILTLASYQFFDVLSTWAPIAAMLLFLVSWWSLELTIKTKLA